LPGYILTFGLARKARLLEIARVVAAAYRGVIVDTTTPLPIALLSALR